ncbi:MAG: hypothetical protein ACOYT8_00695 [Candidatus Dependentiae bacterium]
MEYCSYYQANISKSEVWYVTAILRSFEHVAFDRTIDVQESRFEFYVAPDLELVFLHIMNHFIQKGLVTKLEKLPNRLMDPSQVL